MSRPLFVLVLLLGLVPVTARAQGRAVHSVSDAVYFGLSAGPAAAYTFAYDLDVLVTDTSTGISLGPSFSVAFGGDASAEHGLRQEYLLASDFVRVRATVVQRYGLRVTVLLGGGMYFASLPDQTTVPHPAQLPDLTPVVVTEHFPGVFVPGAMLTTGIGTDWYWDGRWGVGGYFVAHVRLDDQARMPSVWMEIGVGMRLGE